MQFTTKNITQIFIEDAIKEGETFAFRHEGIAILM